MKVRIISAIIALAVFIPLIWFGGYPFVIVMGIISVLAYKELLDLKKSHKDIPNIVKILGLLLVVYLVVGDYGKESVEMISYAKILLPFILLIPAIFYKKDKYKTSDAFYLIGGVLLIGLVFNLLLSIRAVNIHVLIYLLVLAIVSDTLAYAIGTLIGKHKMCPKISPAKSWEGAIAGSLGSIIVSLIVYHNLIAPLSVNAVILTILLVIAGELGDLVFSKIKRENDIKDFSNIMPGHGGILDRIDSIAFVVIAYVILRTIL